MATDYVEQIEKIKNDSSLSADQKKKELKRLRRMIRKNRSPEEKAASRRRVRAEGPADPNTPVTRAHNRPKTVIVSDEPAIPLPEFIEKLESEIKSRKLKQFDSKKQAGLAFPLVLCLKQSITEPQVLFDKFKARWGKEATEYSFITLPKETLFLLGPVTEAGR